MVRQSLLDKIKAQGEAVAAIREERERKRLEAEAQIAAAKKLAEGMKIKHEERMIEVKALVGTVVADICNELNAAKLDPNSEPLNEKIEHDNASVSVFTRFSYVQARREAGTSRVFIRIGWVYAGPGEDVEMRSLWIGGESLVEARDRPGHWTHSERKGDTIKSERVGFSRLSVDAVEAAIESVMDHYYQPPR